MRNWLHCCCTFRGGEYVPSKCRNAPNHNTLSCLITIIKKRDYCFQANGIDAAFEGQESECSHHFVSWGQDRGGDRGRRWWLQQCTLGKDGEKPAVGLQAAGLAWRCGTSKRMKRLQEELFRLETPPVTSALNSSNYQELSRHCGWNKSSVSTHKHTHIYIYLQRLKASQWKCAVCLLRQRLSADDERQRDECLPDSPHFMWAMCGGSRRIHRKRIRLKKGTWKHLVAETSFIMKRNCFLAQDTHLGF